MTERVVVSDRLAAPGLALLKATAGLDVVETVGQGPEALRRALADAAALVVRSETQVSAELMAAGPALRIVARAGIGTDNIDMDEATRRGIAVLTAPGANSTSAAEHTFALLLALARRIPWAAQSVAQGEWERKAFEGAELRGKTLGLVGLGRIGTQVASFGRAFGMAVIAHDPYVGAAHALQLGVELLPLEELLARADVVSLHLGLTDDTRHLLDASRLAMMKEGALLVNTARGALIDDVALARGLARGRPAGAALDVFEPEPLPPTSPLRGLSNVVLTPHLAASTPEAQARVALEIGAAVRDALLKGDLRGAVNLPGLNAAQLAAYRPLIDLGRRLGKLAVALASGGVQAVDAAYHGTDDQAAEPAGIAALWGVLEAMGIERVSLVNAVQLARQRGIKVTRRAEEPAGFASSLAVALEAGGRRVIVKGALFGEAHARIVGIGDHHVDVEPEGTILVLTNRDVPGVIGRVGTLFGEAGLNISTYHQARPPRPGAEALAAIELERRAPADVLEKLRRMADVTGVWQVDLGPIPAP